MIKIETLDANKNSITCRITAPMYWWSEFDIGVILCSERLDQTLCRRCLTINDFSFEDMHGQEWILGVLLDNLNARIKDYKAGMKKNIGLWRTIIQLLPNAYNQTKIVEIYYRVAERNMKETYKLSEWYNFYNYIFTNLRK